MEEGMRGAGEGEVLEKEEALEEEEEEEEEEEARTIFQPRRTVM
jgi:hypothetical protein